MRIGLFGGTFSPIHRGHVALAQEALATLRLDHLYWIPAHPWQKTGVTLLADDLRAQLIEACIRTDTRQSVDRCEIDVMGPSYSIETIKGFKNRFPHDELFYLVGADQWENFHTWRNWQDILQAVTLVVFARDGVQLAANVKVQAFLKMHPQAVQFLPLPSVPVSSTHLREVMETEGIHSEKLSAWIPEDALVLLRKESSVKGCDKIFRSNKK